MANEAALKDGNRIPTLLFEENGETRRVSPVKPLPVADLGDDAFLVTETKELTGNGSQIMIAPSPGKRLVIKGCSIAHEVAAGGESTLLFQGGRLVHRVYRSDESGNLIRMNLKGNVDEPLLAEITNVTGAKRAFFIVNHLEE